MSLVLLEDQKRPLPKHRYVVFDSFVPLRPFYRIARFTYRSTRLLAARVSQILRRPGSAQTDREQVYEVLPHKQS